MLLRIAKGLAVETTTASKAHARPGHAAKAVNPAAARSSASASIAKEMYRETKIFSTVAVETAKKTAGIKNNQVSSRNSIDRWTGTGCLTQSLKSRGMA